MLEESFVRVYLDHGEEASAGETRSALELFGGVELVLKVLLGDWGVICEG